MDVEEIDLDEWRSGLPNSGFEVFHTPEALSVVDRHTNAEMHLYGGFKGDQLVAMVPLFERDVRLGRALFSPPPSMGVPRLGPLVMPNSPKQSSQERVNNRFMEQVIAAFDATSPRTLFYMVGGTEFDDPRPYQWADFDLTPNFTYRLDLSTADPDSLLGDFSKSLRRDIRDASDLNVTVERGGLAGARSIYEQTRERYEEQDEGFGHTWPYVSDLFEALSAEQRARAYTIRDEDGQFISGILVLYSNDAAYFWLGGARTVHEGVGLNSLLHWEIIRDIIEDPPRESVTQYDLMGANTERLCRYKSKFGADLVPYFVVESGGPSMDLAKRAYKIVTG